ncbi:MAG TPA: DegT/DnrJ/EryC1/StrS family aminotransferase, partial [Pyrinomonadaceae bacterium]|nr:DegT/DnrJ/EryC1/StrS family aminotransferase [Pyrinomonadaceae bacterium]
GLPVEREGYRHIYNQFVIRVPAYRNELREFLAENGVGTDIYYPIPLHMQECFAFLGGALGDLPESERAAHETLALPVFPELRSEQLDHVVETIRRYFEQKL